MALTRAGLLRVGTASTTGAIQVGAGLSITSDGVLSGSGGGGSGTVTSVNIDGGTSGLVFSGGPITTSGTITVTGGTLGTAFGGTGTTTGGVSQVIAGAGLTITPTEGTGVVTISIETGQGFPGTEINIPTIIPSSNPTTWQSPSDVIFATGCLEISKDNITFTQQPISINLGDLLYVRWIESGECSQSPHDTTITGSITNGTYIQNASFTIDRIPDPFVLDDLTNQPLSTTITSNPTFLSGLNVPAYVTMIPDGTLTNVQASIGSTAFVGIPTSGNTLIINPNQSIQLRGTTGPTVSTNYFVSIQVGDLQSGVTTDTWNVTTVSVAPSISQPSITAPINGATGINPALNDPAQINFTSSSYTPLNGAGSQISSIWEITSGSAGGTPISGSPFTRSSSPFTSLTVPQSSFSPSTTYYSRVQYSSSSTTSNFSSWSSFSTANSFAIPAGTFTNGGYYGGQINISGNIYNLIVAPTTSGSLQGQFGGTSAQGIEWKVTIDAAPSVADDEYYGSPATSTLANTTYPIFNWCRNSSSGPRGGSGINGLRDWYIPARYELLEIMRNLGPYETNTPTDFKIGGPQAFGGGNTWTASQAGTTYAWAIGVNKSQNNVLKYALNNARAIRRVAA